MENIVERRKKKKPAFGFFATLNPDAGDVEKNIDRFNNSTSDNISADGGQGLAEELLKENKVVSFDGNVNPNSGWVVIMAGGPGSGKGFVFDTLVPIHGKKLDVDQLKTYKLRRSEITDDTITFRDGTTVNLTDAGIDEPYDLSNPKFVALLHDKTKALKKAQRSAVFNGILNASKDRLPNIIFDITMDKISAIEDVLMMYKPMGYKVAVVCVFTEIDVAISQNEKRARKVDVDMLLDKHSRVYNTLEKLLGRKDLTDQINDIWVVQQYSIDVNSKTSMRDYIKSNNVTHIPKDANGLYYLEHDMQKFIDNQLDRIFDINHERRKERNQQKSFEDAEFGTSMDGGKMMESYLVEEDKEEEITAKNKEEAYKAFEDIVKDSFPFVSEINKQAEELYMKHQGDEVWDSAYEEWQKNMKLTEAYDGADDIYDYVNVVTMEDMREGSIDNMDDDDIDFQERTFYHICKKLKASERDIVAIKYDSGYYDYNPDYMVADLSKTDDKYGSLCDAYGITFFKEKKYPFLYFRNEDDLREYVFKMNEEFES